MPTRLIDISAETSAALVPGLGAAAGLRARWRLGDIETVDNISALPTLLGKLYQPGQSARAEAGPVAAKAGSRIARATTQPPCGHDAVLPGKCPFGLRRLRGWGRRSTQRISCPLAKSLNSWGYLSMPRDDVHASL